MNASTRQSGATDSSTSRPLTKSANSLALSQPAIARPTPPPIDGEHQALGQELTDEASAARADGEANRDLALPGAAARASSRPDRFTQASSRMSADDAHQDQQRLREVVAKRVEAVRRRQAPPRAGAGCRRASFSGARAASGCEERAPRAPALRRSPARRSRPASAWPAAFSQLIVGSPALLPRSSS